MDNVDNLGEYIRQQRIEKGLTIEELSAKTKISVAVLRDIEAGQFDRYKGDEAYVKMYLKKIGAALSVDTNDLTNQYIELTKEIELEELQEKEEAESKPKKSRNFSFETPEFTRKPSVYEDKSHVTVIRTGIILALVCLVIIVIWYGFYSTRSQSKEPSFVDQNQTTTEGVDPNENSDSENTQNKDNQNNQEQTTQEITFTRDESSASDVIDYHMKLPTDTKTIKFKIEFGSSSWSSLTVNGQNYSSFEHRIYNYKETVELEFNVDEFESLSLRNGFSEGHHYYINDQEVPLKDEDSSSNPSNFNLTLDKE